MPEIIQKYFPGLENVQLKQFALLGELYQDWNQKINVISRKDIQNLYVNHVLHSLSIAKVIQFKPRARVMDAGTGGGFPGVPLAILFPGTEFFLVDSIRKKIKVVNEVAMALDLENVHATQERMENTPGNYDFVISRAVTRLPEFVKLTRNKLSRRSNHAMPNGVFYLKGGDFSEELAPFRQKARVYEISNFFGEPFFETKKIIYLPLARPKK